MNLDLAQCYAVHVFQTHKMVLIVLVCPELCLGFFFRNITADWLPSELSSSGLI